MRADGLLDPKTTSHEHAGAAPAAPPLSGLVSLGTRDTPADIPATDGRVRRLRRMKRGVLHAAKIHQTALEQSRSRFRGALITTTYAPGVEWSPNHIKSLVK